MNGVLPRAPMHPFFVYGELVSGRSLAWVLSGTGEGPRSRAGSLAPKAAQVRGQLWRLTTGQHLLAANPQGRWIEGEIHPCPDPSRFLLLCRLLGVAELGLDIEILPARVDSRAVRVAALTAALPGLRRLGAHPLRLGDWKKPFSTVEFPVIT